MTAPMRAVFASRGMKRGAYWRRATLAGSGFLTRFVARYRRYQRRFQTYPGPIRMSDADQFPPDSTISEPPAGPSDAEIFGSEAAGVQPQLDEQREKYLRLAAEYDNYRRRTTRERQDAHRQGQAD